MDSLRLLYPDLVGMRRVTDGRVVPDIRDPHSSGWTGTAAK